MGRQAGEAHGIGCEQAHACFAVLVANRLSPGSRGDLNNLVLELDLVLRSSS